MRRFLAPIAMLSLAFGIFIPVAASAQTSTTILGAFVPSFTDFQTLSSAVTTAGASQGITTSLGIDNDYKSFAWPNLTRAANDVLYGFSPMISWSPSTGATTCVSLVGVRDGLYDSSVLAPNLALLESLPSSATVYVRLFYEMTDSQAEQCANPTGSSSVYQEAFQHVVDYFRANLTSGAPNIVWVFAPGEPAFVKGTWSNYYPGSDYVDIIGEDLYNRTDSQLPFPGEVCQDAAGYSKPLMISETGALANVPIIGDAVQVYWLSTVPAACSNLYAFLYWDAVGGDEGPLDYTLDPTDSKVMNAFAAIAMPPGPRGEARSHQ